MEDSPLFVPNVRTKRVPTEPIWTPSEVEIGGAPTAIVEATVALRHLSPTSPPPSTLAIRISDLRGRSEPLRLADLRQATDAAPPAPGHARAA